MHVLYRHRDRTLDVQLQRRDATHFSASVDGRLYELDAEIVSPLTLMVSCGGCRVAAHVSRADQQVHVIVNGRAYMFTAQSGGVAASDVGARVSPEVTAPMPGKVLRLSVREGQGVTTGDDLLILEAMKMETRITADGAGIVRKVLVSEGQMVDAGQILVKIEYEG
jgi:propionyl-CoA carboxylase alpha chain